VGERIISLDILRGATIAAMILVNTPGSWEYVYPPLLHSPWNGITFTDIIFPFFLFIVGISISLSLRSFKDDQRIPTSLLLKLVKRSAILFFIGLTLNAFPYFDLSILRIPGVLQRIAIVFFISAMIFLYCNVKGQIIICFSILGMYWLLMKVVPFPGHEQGILTPEDNLAAWIDHALLKGHLWNQTKVWDPEGLLSTMPAISSGLIGVIFGQFFLVEKDSQNRWSTSFVMANLLMLGGILIDPFFPINKSIWSSSYVLFTSGIAMQTFLCFHWIIEVKKWSFWLQTPMIHFGSNAITAYAFSGVLAMLLYTIQLADGSLYNWIYVHGFLPFFLPRLGSFLFAFSFLIIIYVIIYLLYKRQVFIKV